MLGVYPEEKENSRAANIFVECEFDWSQLEKNDDLSLVPDYTGISGLIEKQSKVHVELIEHWVIRLARSVLAIYPKVTKVRIRLEKPEPSGLRIGSTAWAELELKR